MNTATFAFLFILLSSIHASELKNSLDDNLFKTFLDEAYKKKGAGADAFINKIWPKIMSGLIPDSVLIPAAENTCQSCGQYICATEFKIYPILKRINQPMYGKVSRGLFGKGWKSTPTTEKTIKIEVDVDMELSKPLNLELAVKKKDDSTLGMFPVSYTLKGKNPVKIVLTIPDFSQIDRKYINRNCLVYINSVYVSELGSPVMDKKITKGKKEIELATDFKRSITFNYRYLFTVGIVKAVKERLGIDSWICAHQSFKDQVKKYEEEKHWDYSPMYKQYCNDKRAP